MAPLQKLCIAVLFVVFYSFPSAAQEIRETNTDSLLFRGIDQYRNGKFKNSLVYAERGLELAPDYHDLRILKIRNLQALREISLAKTELLHLFKVSPNYPGLVDLAYRQASLYKEKTDALNYLKEIRVWFSDNRRFQFLHIEILLDLNHSEEAEEMIRVLEKSKDLSREERYRLTKILERVIKKSIGLDHQVFFFGESYGEKGPWHYTSLEYKQLFSKTAVIARTNYFVKDTRKGSLYELEAYPVLNEKLYFYLNMGLSDSQVFPGFKGSLSAYYNLPVNVELEAGGRMVKFDNDPVFMAVAGASTYVGSFYFNARSILGPQKEERLVQNYQVNARYYYKGSNNYIFSRIGTGISPLDLEVISQLQEISVSKAQYFTMGVHFSVQHRHLFRLECGMVWEETPHINNGFQVLPSVGYRLRL